MVPMPGKLPRPSRAALYVLAHAWVAVKPQTAEEAVACNMQLTRMRDFIIQQPATAIIEAGVVITAEEFSEERGNALVEMRSRCRSCGLCARFDLKPP